MPPKSCLTTMMATAAPTMHCQMGILTGRFRARIRPVTAADRSITVLGRFMPFSNSHSKNTQAATHTTSTSSARMPKNSTEAITAGIRAISTSRMMVWVVSFPWICGETDTIIVSFIRQPPPLSSLRLPSRPSSPRRPSAWRCRRSARPWPVYWSAPGDGGPGR